MDYERYGDYTETEEDIPRGHNIFATVLKILIAAVCIAVVGLIAVRLILMSYYPPAMRRLAFTENLTEYYQRTDGNIGALTQELRFEYDQRLDPPPGEDAVVGSFFAAYMTVIPGAGELQVTLRYNVSAMEDIAARYGIDPPDPADPGLRFRLVDNLGGVYENLTCCDTVSFSMYRYVRLAFDGLEIQPGGEGSPAWIRLEIYVGGQDGDTPYSAILLYEDHESYSDFKEYKLSGGEVPA